MTKISAQTKKWLLVFFVPFIIFGAGFSVYAVNSVAHYQLAEASLIDFVIAIFWAFADVGISAGVAALCIVSILDKIRSAYAKRFQRR